MTVSREATLGPPTVLKLPTPTGATGFGGVGYGLHSPLRHH